ncbi:hypothetical protein QE406_001741 [Microbacterium testaceum]|nr:hypothetical protein [Microbacterium testaceum]
MLPSLCFQFDAVTRSADEVAVTIPADSRLTVPGAKAAAFDSALMPQRKTAPSTVVSAACAGAATRAPPRAIAAAARLAVVTRTNRRLCVEESTFVPFSAPRRVPTAGRGCTRWVLEGRLGLPKHEVGIQAMLRVGSPYLEVRS